MSFLAAADIHVRVDGFSLRGISFDLCQGERLSIIGPSGAGKSVLLNAIAGFHSMESGTLVLDGRDVTTVPPERRDIGIVYQDYALFPHLTVFSNIAYGLQARKHDRGALRKRVENIAGVFGLGGLLDKRPGSLSGGEQQRTALARALVFRPRLLIMDEPFSSLDPPLRRELRRTVRDLVAENGITMLHVAHDLDDMWALADKTLVIREGAAEAFGSVNEVTRPPAVPFLCRAEGVCVIEGTVKERREGVSFVNAGGVSLATSDPAGAGEKVRLVLHPEDVTLYTERPKGVSARNVLESRITGFHRKGEAALVMLRSGETDFNAFLTANALESLSLATGDDVFTTIKAVHLKVE